MSSEEKPQYLIAYKCKTCGEISHFADTQEPICHFCDEGESAGLEVVDKQLITPELLAQQLKASMDSTFKNLQMAFENMTDEDKESFGEVDAEKEMLLLLEKTKKLKEEIEKLDLKKPE